MKVLAGIISALLICSPASANSTYDTFLTTCMGTPLHYWPLSAAYTDAGSGSHITITANGTCSTGNALATNVTGATCTGTNSGLALNNDFTSQDSSTRTETVLMWIKGASTASYLLEAEPGGVTLQRIGLSYGIYSLYTNPPVCTGGQALFVTQAVGNATGTCGTTNIVDGNPHLLGFTCYLSGSYVCAVNIDGVAQNTWTPNLNTPNVFTYVIGSINTGSGVPSTATSGPPFNGSIGGVAQYVLTALTPTQQLALYKCGTGTGSCSCLPTAAGQVINFAIAAQPAIGSRPPRMN